MNSIEKYLESKALSKATIKCYNTEILEFITWCDIENIEAENASITEVTSYLKHLQNKGQQGITRSINLNTLKHYFDYLIQNEIRNDNPAKHIKIRGTKQKHLYPIFTKEELESIYKNYTIPNAEDERSNRNWFSNYKKSKQRNKAILSLMIYQALTTDEINRLTIKDVKLKEGTIFIQGTRKSNERELELKPHQIMEMMEYQLTTRKELLQHKPCHPERNEGTKETEAYFIPLPSAGKKQTTDNDTTNIWKALSREIKTQNKKFINFQQVRTSVITHWLKQYNLRQVQYMAGHRYISSTESYLANQVEELQNDIDNFHPIG
jgi:site-specific recombinase XerD